MPAPRPPNRPAGRLKLDFRAVAEVLANGHKEVTMAEIAAGVGVAKPTLYKLAGSKAELIRACVDAETERLMGQIYSELAGMSGAGAPELLAAALRAVSRYAEDSPGGFFLLFAQKGADADEARLRLEARMTEWLRANARDASRALERPDLLAAALLGAATAVVLRARADGAAVDARAVAADLSEALRPS